VRLRPPSAFPFEKVVSRRTAENRYTSGVSTRPHHFRTVTRREFLATALAATGASHPVIAADDQTARPTGDDFSARSLWACEEELRNAFGGDSAVTTAAKADHFEWVIARYHLAPTGLVHETVVLPESPGQAPSHQFGDDVVTWNGALLSALAHKYAVTGDPHALALIRRVLDGLRLAVDVTGAPGLAARCVLRSDVPVEGATRRYDAPDGTVYHFRSDAAKGTYNQLAGGLAAVSLLAANALPPEAQGQLRNLTSELALHLIGHEYRLTEKGGARTEHGDIRPRIGPQSIPFNAQGAYRVVAAGASAPPDDPGRRGRIEAAFQNLRHDHHVYYEHPGRSLLLPQRVGDSPFVKGMNDRNHVMSAAYHGLLLELHAAAREGRAPDTTFLHQLGQTMLWMARRLRGERNALCVLMWAGILSDPTAAAAILPRSAEREAEQAYAAQGVADAVEQLRRFPVHRFRTPGRIEKTRQPQWSDAMPPQETYLWKAGPYDLWIPDGPWDLVGPPTPRVNSSIDYMHAYWVMRYWLLNG